ncbi:hypothetical protein CV770_39930 [Bradyrhizobium sp. AC87j1]|uniref:hypothetical protein n=1 Tax=Bradyrhizobium sp. AC87j1 TaxID=2055894 RepID=UPI000CECE0BE|nr:hypothetical protein [Bradyrhizobium sp. AC87j1]PPQ13899.1 hypothetical protein CV770_39930 [Bradyrhizobium sp. AC87j1]
MTHRQTLFRQKWLVSGAAIIFCSAWPARAADVASGTEAANTKEFVTYFSPNDFKVLNSDDLHDAPAKFIGKPIELRNVRCLYAMEGYHCIAPLPSAVTVVFADSAAPAAEREALRNDCAAIQMMAKSRACRKNIRIIPDDLTESSLPNGIGKRVVVRAEKIEVLPASRPER